MSSPPPPCPLSPPPCPLPPPFPFLYASILTCILSLPLTLFQVSSMLQLKLTKIHRRPFPHTHTTYTNSWPSTPPHPPAPLRLTLSCSMCVLQGWTALHCAAYKGHVDCAYLLLQHGVEVSAQSAVVGPDSPGTCTASHGCITCLHHMAVSHGCIVWTASHKCSCTLFSQVSAAL